MRLLVVEDDPSLRSALLEGLGYEGFAVDACGDGMSALDALDTHAYDVLVLDRDLPGVHGDEVCRRVVGRQRAPAVLMLTAAGQLQDKMAGFGMGADDYLPKPFEFLELVVRIRALGRRGTPRPPTLSRQGVVLDQFTRRVMRDGMPVRLTPKELAVLEVLMNAEGGVVSAETLLEKAWDENANPFTNSTRVTMSSLRRKLGVPWVIRDDPGCGLPDRPRVSPASRTGSFSIRTRLAITYALVLVISGAALITMVYLFMRFVPAYAITSAGSEQAPTTQASPVGPTSTSSSDALTLTSATDILQTLLWVSVGALTVLAVVGSLIGWVVAGRALRPLQDVEAAARRAAAGDLSHRIEPRGPDDEVRRLAVSFDRMLDQLERSFNAHAHFSANAAHELRTPLSATRTILDVAAAHPDRTDVVTLVQRLRTPTDRSADLVSALLVLAEIDAAAVHLERVDVAALTAAVVAEHHQTAAARGVAVSDDLAAATATADPRLLRLAVDNLIRNAVSHNRRGGCVTVTVRQEQLEVLVRVDNTGPIVSDDVVHLLTQPFYRVRERVREDGDGLGLGLALVQAVTLNHRGRLVITPHPDGGLQADLLIPLG